jgi:hypothetical protein
MVITKDELEGVNIYQHIISTGWQGEEGKGASHS